MRWIILFVLLLWAGALVEARIRRLLSSREGRRPAGSGTKREVRHAELVPCAACGLHVARPRCLEKHLGGKLIRFCSPACADRRGAGGAPPARSPDPPR